MLYVYLMLLTFHDNGRIAKTIFQHDDDLNILIAHINDVNAVISDDWWNKFYILQDQHRNITNSY